MRIEDGPPELIEFGNQVWEVMNNRLNYLLRLLREHRANDNCEVEWCISTNINEYLDQFGADEKEGLLHAAVARLIKENPA